jgi:hypothetical protein
MIRKDFYEQAKLLVNREGEYVIRLEEGWKNETVNYLGRPLARRLEPRLLFATIQHTIRDCVQFKALRRAGRRQIALKLCAFHNVGRRR